MQKIFKVVRWTIINATIAAFAWQGIINDVVWAANVFKFIMWLNLIATALVVFSLAGKIEERKAFSKKLSVPMSVGLSFDLLLSVFVAANGWFGYATINIIQGVLLATTYVDKEKDDTSLT